MLTLKLFGSMSLTLELASGAQKLSLTPRLAELLKFLAVGRGRFFSRLEIARESARLRNIYIEIAAKLMRINAAREHYDEAIACGGRILAIDLPREEIQREVMRLQAFSWRRALAMRQFEICRDALRNHLGISPNRSRARRLSPR